MTSDDSFTFRQPASDDEPKDEIYLIYAQQQHGPYSLGMVSLLQAKGTLPKDALYWREGMAGARALADLADEITASSPRPHHYRFAYRWMPMLVFGSPLSREACHSTKQQLLQSWTIAGQEMAKGDIDSPNGLDAEVLPFTPEADLLLITMPTPRRNTEAYFIGIISPRPHDVKRIRYFILSHSNANELHGGGSEGCIREITADGKNFRAKDFVEPFKDDFIAAIRELCKSEAQGWSCVHP